MAEDFYTFVTNLENVLRDKFVTGLNDGLNMLRFYTKYEILT